MHYTFHMIRIFFLFLFTLSAQAKNCNDAYYHLVRDGALVDEDLVEKFKCDRETEKSKESICVLGGEVKSEFREKYGRGHVIFIESDDPATPVKEVEGEWYSRKSSSKKVDILVTNNDYGSKILKKTFEGPSLVYIEKINISNMEKTLYYEKNIKSKSGAKREKQFLFHCRTFELDDPYAGKNLDRDGLPIRKGISSRARKNLAPPTTKGQNPVKK